MELSRVLEVVCDRGTNVRERWSVGSGYLVSERVVLTAAHVVDGADDVRAKTLEAYDLTFPDLPSSELEPDELIEQAAVRFERHQAARDARRWMEIKVKSNRPIGVCFMGDPHIDNVAKRNRTAL